jgi:hypothetical protein
MRFGSLADPLNLIENIAQFGFGSCRDNKGGQLSASRNSDAFSVCRSPD